MKKLHDTVQQIIFFLSSVRAKLSCRIRGTTHQSEDDRHGKKNRSTGKDDCRQDTFSGQVHEKQQKFLLHYNTHGMEAFLQKRDKIM